MAGLAAAAYLSRAGHVVAVFDKAPEPTTAGSGLIIQPTGQAALRALGCLEALYQRGARLARLEGRLEDGARKVLDVRYDALGPDMHGVAIHRAALFDILHGAASKAGAELLYGFEAARVDGTDEEKWLRFSSGASAGPFDLVVDALGVKTPLVERSSCYLDYGALWGNAPFPSAHGFSDDALVQRYRNANVSAGIMPIGTLRDGEEPLAAFFWTLHPVHYEAWRLTPLERWKAKVRALWPEAAPALDHFTDHDQFILARYAHHTAPRPVEGRLVHIGDAWHAASPQLGQGANMALLDAWALSKALAMHDELDDGLAAFVKMRGEHVKLYQTISKFFTPVYQSDSKLLPALRDRLAEPLSNFWFMPKLAAALVAGTLGGPLKAFADNSDGEMKPALG